MIPKLRPAHVPVFVAALATAAGCGEPHRAVGATQLVAPPTESSDEAPEQAAEGGETSEPTGPDNLNPCIQACRDSYDAQSQSEGAGDPGVESLNQCLQSCFGLDGSDLPRTEPPTDPGNTPPPPEEDPVEKCDFENYNFWGDMFTAECSRAEGGMDCLCSKTTPYGYTHDSTCFAEGSTCASLPDREHCCRGFR